MLAVAFCSIGASCCAVPRSETDGRAPGDNLSESGDRSRRMPHRLHLQLGTPSSGEGGSARVSGGRG